MTDSGAKFDLTPTSEKLAAILAIWRELAADGIGPKRDAITPARLRGTMPWVFLLDVVGEDFKFRFAGERIIQFMERRLQSSLLSEHRGTPFFDGMHNFFSRAVLTRTAQAYGPGPVTYPGKEHFEMEVMVLPLSDDGQSVSGLLGTFDTWRLGTHGLSK
ncbi:MAG TPA: PAS domain-containing protein [Rhizomicrobium sp.]|jgi:hypothetical protein|nr:PAS domain-containing protein [Rhizomicrobium sp.]